MSSTDILVIYEQVSQKTYCDTICKALKKRLKNPPITVYRALSPSEGECSRINTFYNENEALLEKTIVLIKLEDLKKLGADIHACNTWEWLVKNTYDEIRKLRRRLPSSLIKSKYVIVDFDFDGYAFFAFDSAEGATSSIKTSIAFNRKHLGGQGYKEVSKNNKTPSSLIVVQSIVVSFLIQILCGTQKNDEAIKDAMRLSYLLTYYLGNTIRKTTKTNNNSRNIQFPIAEIESFMGFGCVRKVL